MERELLNLSWAQFKAIVDQKYISVQYVQTDLFYFLKAIDGNFVIGCLLNLSDPGQALDVVEFEADYKPSANRGLARVGIDGRPVVQSTPRVLSTFTYFTGADDDHSNAMAVGGADTVDSVGHHSIGDAVVSDPLYLDLNTIENKTHIFTGILSWKDALNDQVTLEIVPKVSSYVAGTGTYYNLYNGYLVIPAAGDGLIDVTDLVLVQCVPNEFGVMPAGYWDADFNTTTGQFENITAAPGGDGGYNMFGAEVVLNRFGNKLNLLGSDTFAWPSYDTTQIGHGMRIKVVSETKGTDHEWWWCLNFAFYRKKTC